MLGGKEGAVTSGGQAKMAGTMLLAPSEAHFTPPDLSGLRRCHRPTSRVPASLEKSQLGRPWVLKSWASFWLSGPIAGAQGRCYSSSTSALISSRFPCVTRQRPVVISRLVMERSKENAQRKTPSPLAQAKAK